MRKKILQTALCLFFCYISHGQSKTVVGIVAFKDANSDQQRNSYSRTNQNQPSQYTTAIQDAVTEAFLNAKRFTLVERDKMDQLKSEKNLQKNEDFIDGSVVEQSASLGAQYIVVGNIAQAGVETSNAYVPIAGSVTTSSAKISFTIKVLDVSTGEVIATNNFHGASKGKNGFDVALGNIKPEIETFIKNNFKVTMSVAEIEEKGTNGDAAKILIAGGSSIGILPNTVLKVYALSELTVDGKKLIRKKTIGKITVLKVEDENFSVCQVNEGGEDIAQKIKDGAKIKCEIIDK